MRTLLILIVSIAIAGCEALSPAVLVKDTRIIGGEVSVEGDPTRASPRPGETANVLFYVASPVGVSDSLNWAFYSCLQSPTAGGLPRCDGEPALDALVTGSDTPMFSLVTPTPEIENTPGVMSDAKPTLLILGVVCMNGTPTFDATTMQPSCGADATRTFPLVMRVPIQMEDSDANRNPVFGDILHLGDSETSWPANDAEGIAATGCASLPETPELPHLSRMQGPRTINFVMLDRANAEVTATADDGTQSFETLQVDMLTTRGEADGLRFEVLESGEIPERFDLVWEPLPEPAVPAEGELVKFWFVMRDGRNGATMTQRAVCLLP